MNEEIIKLLEKIGVISKESENSKHEIVQNKNTNTLQLKRNINIENKKFKGFYDVVVHIDSIKDINKGWKLR